jgi:tetratricopeptide (TPR) repeat protein
LVRYQGIVAQRSSAPQLTPKLLEPALTDPVRVNRLEAVRQLLAMTGSLSETSRIRLAAGMADFETLLRHDLSQAEGWINLGNLQNSRGDAVGAEYSFRAAVRINRHFVPAWINLADLLRSGGREADAESSLRDALLYNSRSSELRSALGLSLVRQGRKSEALVEFAAAHRTTPADPHARYVYALALHDAGQVDEARRVLTAGIEMSFDRDLALTLASFAREAGDAALVEKMLSRLREVNPGDPALAGASR